MRKNKLNTVLIILTFFTCISIIIYTAQLMENNISVINSIQQDDLMLILDAGHGGIDGGCSTADGKTEKDINLNIMLSVRDLSKMFGYETEVTRDTDKSIHDKDITGIKNQKISDMKNRLELFNKFNNAVCISIHQNTFSDPQFKGAQMFYSNQNTESEQLAAIMQKRFVNNLQPDNQREIKLCGSELYLCYYCTNPAIMVECGFLSNAEEANKLTNNSYQQKVAFTVFSGINEYVTS